MKTFLSLILVLFSQWSFSQIYGDLAKHKRPIEKQIEYGIASTSHKGQIVFDIVVDEKGNVTSCVLDKAKTNIKSTPTIMKAKNRVLSHLKFKAGYIYPEFHRGEIVFKVYLKYGH